MPTTTGYVAPDAYATTLVEAWRDRAKERREEGASATADVYEKCARELEDAQRAHRLTMLSATDAATESGYSAAMIRQLRKKGTISARREDLPRRPGHGVRRETPVVPITSGASDRASRAAAGILAARTTPTHRVAS